jgi:hypothetical protein
VRRTRKKKASRARVSGHVRSWSPVSSFSGADIGLSRFLFPADVTGSAGPDFVGLDLDLVFASPEDGELKRVPLRFERRWLAADAIDAWGFDSDSALAAHIHALRSGDWAMEMRPAGTRLRPSQFLLLIELTGLMVPGNRVALTRRGAAAPGLGDMQDLNAGPPVPEGLEQLMRALVLLEDYLGEAIVVPEVLSASAAE